LYRLKRIGFYKSDHLQGQFVISFGKRFVFGAENSGNLGWNNIVRKPTIYNPSPTIPVRHTQSFDFNSLNNIYSLVYQGSGQALTAIAGLSDLLRYMLYDAAEKVPLETEMDYIQKYIGLQQLRFEDPVEVNMKVEGSLAGIIIAPLLLIPFVENAFKHGDLGKGGLSIYLNSDAQKTYFHCTNRKGLQQKDPGGGIGLENVKRRLSLLYPGKHILSIDDGPVNFSINLHLTHD